ncbi:hypothetical protein NIASO_20640 [Niabella soli DSM 19437]|uniref:Uncharacterized protein n=1 Tax=Niabella soli DSM 19437 TaxID=929713 RepID=W0F519_9BACT|nr:hypothetical protein NIASO_20640 [Niabella soli DSM 19437]
MISYLLPFSCSAIEKRLKKSIDCLFNPGTSKIQFFYKSSFYFVQNNTL